MVVWTVVCLVGSTEFTARVRSADRESPGSDRRHRRTGCTKRLQRAQKVQRIRLLAGTGVVEILLHGRGVAATGPVCLDCFEQVRTAAVMPQEYALSQAPQRTCAELVPTGAAL